MSYEFTSEAAIMHSQICGGPFFKFDLGSAHVLALISKQDDWDVVTLTSDRAASLSDANGFGVSTAENRFGLHLPSYDYYSIHRLVDKCFL